MSALGGLRAWLVVTLLSTMHGTEVQKQTSFPNTYSYQETSFPDADEVRNETLTIRQVHNAWLRKAVASLVGNVVADGAFVNSAINVQRTSLGHAKDVFLASGGIVSEDETFTEQGSTLAVSFWHEEPRVDPLRYNGSVGAEVCPDFAFCFEVEALASKLGCAPKLHWIGEVNISGLGTRRASVADAGDPGGVSGRPIDEAKKLGRLVRCIHSMTPYFANSSDDRRRAALGRFERLPVGDDETLEGLRRHRLGPQAWGRTALSDTLVFSHNDLHMNNLLKFASSPGHLFAIDFDQALEAAPNVDLSFFMLKTGARGRPWRRALLEAYLDRKVEDDELSDLLWDLELGVARNALARLLRIDGAPSHPNRFSSHLKRHLGLDEGNTTTLADAARRVKDLHDALAQASRTEVTRTALAELGVFRYAEIRRAILTDATYAATTSPNSTTTGLSDSCPSPSGQWQCPSGSRVAGPGPGHSHGGYM